MKCKLHRVIYGNCMFHNNYGVHQGENLRPSVLLLFNELNGKISKTRSGFIILLDIQSNLRNIFSVQKRETTQ